MTLNNLRVPWEVIQNKPRSESLCIIGSHNCNITEISPSMLFPKAITLAFALEGYIYMNHGTYQNYLGIEVDFEGLSFEKFLITIVSGVGYPSLIVSHMDDMAKYQFSDYMGFSDRKLYKFRLSSQGNIYEGAFLHGI